MPNVEQTYTLYASHGRVYAENRDGKLVDIGSVRKEGNVYRCRLDADSVLSEAMESPERAMADIQQRIGFLYMDGQFTALPDVRQQAKLAADAPSTRITLSQEVHEPERGGDTPHIF